ncbi:MAG TPA: hypothetical protein VGQ67_10845 [Candidatus Polarisedimenticolia bacterium]|nr:hypothetical protein [Candidatus Polarisedimenticolia bacterium]
MSRSSRRGRLGDRGQRGRRGRLRRALLHGGHQILDLHAAAEAREDFDIGAGQTAEVQEGRAIAAGETLQETRKNMRV